MVLFTVGKVKSRGGGADRALLAASEFLNFMLCTTFQMGLG